MQPEKHNGGWPRLAWSLYASLTAIDEPCNSSGLHGTRAVWRGIAAPSGGLRAIDMFSSPFLEQHRFHSSSVGATSSNCSQRLHVQYGGSPCDQSVSGPTTPSQYGQFSAEQPFPTFRENVDFLFSANCWDIGGRTSNNESLSYAYIDQPIPLPSTRKCSRNRAVDPHPAF